MALQQGRDIPVSFKAQSVLGTEEATGGGATKWLYKEGSTGFSPPQAALITSAINQGDGMTTRGNRGTYSVPGQMLWEGIPGAHEALYEMFFRNTRAAGVTVTQADLASATVNLSVASSVITFSAGDIIAEGVMVGDVIRFSAGLNSADNGKWLRVKALTTTTITVYDTITNVAGPVSTWSFVRPSKLIQGTVAKLITVEEYFTQIDQSLVLSDVKGSDIQFQLGENTTLDVTGNFLGAGYSYKATGASPHFTSPTEPTGSSLDFLDAYFAFGGSDSTVVTGFTLGLDVSAQALAVANQTGKSPDIFQGSGKPTCQFTMAMSDFTLLQSAAAETQVEFMATFANGANCLSLYLGNAILINETISPLGADGASIVTFGMEIGRDARGGAYDRTGLKLMSSAAT